MQSALELLEDIRHGRIPTSPESPDKSDKTDKTRPCADGTPPTPQALAVLRRDVADLHERVVLLRCEARTRKADRPALLAYLGRRIEKVAARCGLSGDRGEPAGYSDASDPFADTALAALRAEFAELTAEGNPYPLGPLADAPFSMDPARLWNGKLMHPERTPE